MKIKVSAPGKLMLFGEHAVVYDRPCIVTAVSSRIHIELEKTPGRFRIDAPQVKDVRFVEETLRFFKDRFKTGNGLSIRTKSDFSCQYGFGSSSAVTVALLAALAKLYNINLSQKEIFDLGYKITLEVQGVGSGFDIAAATYGGTVYFLTAGKKIEPLSLKKINLVIGYSGIKADTPSIVKQLKLKAQNSKLKTEEIFDKIVSIVEEAKKELLTSNWKKVGSLMNENHRLLQSLEVSTEKLDRMCQAAVGAGAYGAKLSGAGGGDCMVALVSDEKKSKVVSAIGSVLGQVIEVDTNAQGVRIEK